MGTGYIILTVYLVGLPICYVKLVRWVVSVEDGSSRNEVLGIPLFISLFWPIVVVGMIVYYTYYMTQRIGIQRWLLGVEYLPSEIEKREKEIAKLEKSTGINNGVE